MKSLIGLEEKFEGKYGEVRSSDDKAHVTMRNGELLRNILETKVGKPNLEYFLQKIRTIDFREVDKLA